MMPVRKSQNWLPGIFNDFFGNEWMEKANSTSPAINIIESEKDYKVEIAAPGLTKDDFSIRIDDDNQISVSMEKKEEHKDENKNGILTIDIPKKEIIPEKPAVRNIEVK